jgi:NADH dehydrogenase
VTYKPNAGPITGPLFTWGPASTRERETEQAPEPLLAGFGEPRTILVAGATGFVGKHIVRRLLGRGHKLRALARRPLTGGWDGDVEWWPADVTDRGSLHGAADGCDAIVDLVGIAWPDRDQGYEDVHVDGTGNLLLEARRAGVHRLVFVSTLGASATSGPYFSTKFKAERQIRDSGIDFVIFRPSIIYGPGDHFTTAIVDLLKRLPVFPILGFSRSRLQPVAIEDIADALVQAVERPDLSGRTFEIAGPERLEFAKIVRIVARALGIRRPVVTLPRTMSTQALWVAARLGFPQPITSDQLAMFRGASVLKRRMNPLRSVFNLEPMAFRVAVRDYL